MRAAKLVFLGLVFFVDVTIHAEGLFLPKKCWGESVPCAVENTTPTPLELALKQTTLYLSPAAVVQATSENQATLARGILFGEAKEAFRWHTPFGDIVCRDCQVLLNREVSLVEIHAIKGHVEILRKGDDQGYELPPGFSVTLSVVQADGKALLERPQAAALRPMAKEWAKVYAGSADEFKEDLKEFVDVWRGVVETASQMHQNEAERQIASADESVRRVQARRRAIEAEDRRIRDLFREKNDL